MNSIEKYLQRQTFSDVLFEDELNPNLGLVVTIPAYAEEGLIQSLESLLVCEKPSFDVEVVVIVNHPINASEDLKTVNQRVFQKAQDWIDKHSNEGIKFLVSHPIELPKKHAGAGLARKIAMDEATRRLQASVYENPIISCFDGDATVSENYFTEIEKHFKNNPKSMGCSINFEHPLDSVNSFQNEGIIQYELHLRYYQAALVYANHPQAQFTVGSSMAVTRNDYVAQGGMNRRKAGEDFWFMLKLMMAGEISAITEATVYPSSRVSFRVPFGTGRAMSEMVEKEDNTYYTAPISSFKRLKVFLTHVDALYDGEVEVKDELTNQFLESIQWKEILEEIRLYTTDLESFRKRFYRWFNLFMVMKFFHWLRDQGVKDEPIQVEANSLLKILGTLGNGLSSKECLLEFRNKKRVQPNDYTL